MKDLISYQTVDCSLMLCKCKFDTPALLLAQLFFDLSGLSGWRTLKFKTCKNECLSIECVPNHVLRTWKKSCTIIPKYYSLVLRDQREIIKEEKFQWSASDYTYSSQWYALCQKRVGRNIFFIEQTISSWTFSRRLTAVTGTLVWNAAQ